MSTVGDSSVAQTASTSAMRELVRVEHEGEFARVTMSVPERRNALSIDHMRELLGAVRAGRRKRRPRPAARRRRAGVLRRPRLRRHGPRRPCRDARSARTLRRAHDDAAVHSAAGRRPGPWPGHGRWLPARRDRGPRRRLRGGGLRDSRRQGRLVLPHAARCGRPRRAAQARARDGLHRRRDRRPHGGGLGPGERGRPGRRARRGVPGSPAPGHARQPRSKALGKQGFYAQVDLDQAKAYAYAIELMAASSQTPDARERMAAFLEKRAPRYD